MTPQKAKTIFATHMQAARKRKLTAYESRQLSVARQALRRQRRPAMNARKNAIPTCPTCGRSIYSPYRVFDDRGKVIQGCVDTSHTGHLTTPSESARFHMRPEARKIRKRLEQGRKGKGYGQSNPQRVVIYGKVERVIAVKTQPHICDADCKKHRHRYFHDFTSSPKMYGLPDGSLLIK